MAELYEDWVVRPMTRAEYNKLSDEEKKERKRIRERNKSRKYREENPDYMRKYYEEHKEERKEYDRLYYQTAAGKKVHTLGDWKNRNLQESKEDLEWIYELYLHQELCYSCDIKLTRDGVCCATQAVLDHSHVTHRFRQICCRSCNNLDSWMKYWC